MNRCPTRGNPWGGRMRRAFPLPMAPQVRKQTLKKRGQRGWGGRWRAFVRMRTFGTKGRPDLGKISVLYDKAVEEGGAEIERAELLGRAAAKAAKSATPKAGQSAFGPKAKDVQRQRQRSACTALATAHTASDEGSILALADRLIASKADLHTCLFVARASSRAFAEQKRQQQSKVEHALRAFEEGPGRAHAHHLQQHMPALQVGGLHAVPSPGGLLFECMPAQPDAVAKSVAWSLASREANTSAVLRQYWQQAHYATKPAAEAKASHVRGATECQQAGRCLCSEAGKKLKALRQAFLKVVKQTCPPKTLARQDLVAGHFVLKVICRPREDDLDAWIYEDEPIRELILHVGRTRLSPFQMTMQLLEKGRGISENLGADGVEYAKAIRWPPKSDHRVCHASN